VGCPDCRIDRLCITCCSSSQLSDAEHPGGLGVDDEFEPARLHDRQVRRFAPLRMLPLDAIRPRRPLIARPTPKPQLNPAIPPTQNLVNLSRAAAHHELLNEKEPGRGSDQALSGRRRGAYCTRNVGPKALPQASSAFRSIVCENIPNIAPHIAANIRMGMVCLRLHSEHQLSRGLRSSVQNRSSTNLRLYKIAHCNLLRSELCLPYSIPPARGLAVKCIN
jgi:hypothetical protein